MMSGFKQFVLRGNVVDMSVGVVVGGAFAAVVAALTISADATDRSTRG
jgi:large conductance mechanosensitive channel